MTLLDKKVFDFLNSYEIKDFIDKIYKKNNVFPKKQDVFKCFNLCPPSKTKVVIIGQDPYHGPNIADGLAFSSQKKTTPPSLKNIFKEINNEYPAHSFKTNNLTCWAKQGVLLLNLSLTVEENKPDSHTWFWKDKMIQIIKMINNANKQIAFVLWGNNAKEIKKHLLNNTFVLTSSHPSPLSANKSFFNNNHFKKINKYLKSIKQTEINWST